MATTAESLTTIAEFGQIYDAMHVVREAIQRVKHPVDCHLTEEDSEALTRMDNIANKMIKRVMATNDKLVEALLTR